MHPGPPHRTGSKAQIRGASRGQSRAALAPAWGRGEAWRAGAAARPCPGVSPWPALSSARLSCLSFLFSVSLLLFVSSLASFWAPPSLSFISFSLFLLAREYFPFWLPLLGVRYKPFVRSHTAWSRTFSGTAVFLPRQGCPRSVQFLETHGKVLSNLFPSRGSEKLCSCLRVGWFWRGEEEKKRERHWWTIALLWN